MVDVKSKALNKTISVDRIIWKINSKITGPTVIFIGGMHGNETAGVFALKHVYKNIQKDKVKGNIYAISGNLSALKQNQRFIHSDLNRMWTYELLKNLETKTSLSAEEEEQVVLYELLKNIINDHSGPFYFIDLHTTSSQSLPFITINDALINRNFSRQFPVPIVLGIEEYLEGPLLSYINTLGYVCLGFESGQHDDINAVTNGISFVNLALVATASIDKNDIDDLLSHYQQLNQNTKHLDEVFEVTHLYRIYNGEDFKMRPNFSSFQKIKKGTILAESDGRDVAAPDSARLFMPLYQNRGKEGFFIIKRIAPFFMGLSSLLRRWRLDNLLVLFPGISWDDKEKGVLKVNLKITRFFAKQLFHLFGYRNKQVDSTHLRLYNRERVSKIDSYKELPWFKGRISMN